MKNIYHSIIIWCISGPFTKRITREEGETVGGRFGDSFSDEESFLIQVP